ncbi:DUF1127 domain-containing protein [Bartonella bacilliformis]|uniref:DUF1127 domain-containing protein n=1 Tax=Bartonella bacilliformis TaxID=774 RepID=UPI00049F32EF|nr:DUF1127 domain-containing protein [Bartonella bacilliformis]KEG20647.1 hypothetical protein H707_00073 [Bartonella bacilliformis Hosp800-02]KEG24753.1 hypothetical protein H703_00074 [Bartonella bacilliformis Ver075]
MGILRSFKSWCRYRRTVKALNSLSTYDLNDVGINRGDIRSVAKRFSCESF